MSEINRDFKGIINLFKPVGPSSFQMVRKVRSMVDEKRVGHAGTLDPLASGVLVVAVGREFTRDIDKIRLGKKSYTASIKLGETSTTDDAEGEKSKVHVEETPSEDSIRDCLKKFTGTIEQLPPVFSAKQIGGKRAYRLARKGHDVKLEPSKVQIFKINLVEYEWPILKIEVECGSGTYIRSLARDIGECLKVGGFLNSLERTAVGQYKIEDSIKLK